MRKNTAIPSPTPALESGSISLLTVVVEPLVEIVLSVLLGLAAGLVLDWSERYFHSRGNRMSMTIAFVLLTVGLSGVEFDVGPVHCGFSLLLVCMMTGTVFCNVCSASDVLMERLDRWSSPASFRYINTVMKGAEMGVRQGNLGLRHPHRHHCGGRPRTGECHQQQIITTRRDFPWE